MFSLAFLIPVLGITSQHEQEGIPVIMCSAEAASGLQTKTQRDTDAAVWHKKAGQEEPLCGHKRTSSDRKNTSENFLREFFVAKCFHQNFFTSDKNHRLKAQIKVWNSQLHNQTCHKFCKTRSGQMTKSLLQSLNTSTEKSLYSICHQLQRQSPVFPLSCQRSRSHTETAAVSRPKITLQ